MAFLLDAETILAGIEQWLQLEQKWGSPVDLDDAQEDLDRTPKMKTTFSSLDLKKSTFDSSFVFKTAERKLGKHSKKSMEYLEFMEDLKTPKRIKPFSYVSGEILSASSVEEICEDIDDVFKSLEKLCSATSTVRFSQVKKRPSINDIVQCSISAADLSFDDTIEPSQDVDRYIDEVFDNLHTTLASLSRTLDDSAKETVTHLVKKFTTILKSPILKTSPGLKRICGEKFRDLAAFWQGQAVSSN
ncbi:uncharacterized protein LOC134665536 [Cydia fagiglandana]|uniref:uncharacterized protein LOC134665536 n=1 Tax=Cydia fagiglandana TaxID=1458189 RepID=UPI002FEE44D1